MEMVFNRIFHIMQEMKTVFCLYIVVCLLLLGHSWSPTEARTSGTHPGLQYIWKKIKNYS